MSYRELDRKQLKAALRVLGEFEDSTVSGVLYDVGSVKSDLEDFANKLADSVVGPSDAVVLRELSRRLQRSFIQCQPVPEPTKLDVFADFDDADGLERHFLECTKQRINDLKFDLTRDVFEDPKCNACDGNCVAQTAPLGDRRRIVVPCICDATLKLPVWKRVELLYVSPRIDIFHSRRYFRLFSN